MARTPATGARCWRGRGRLGRRVCGHFRDGAMADGASKGEGPSGAGDNSPSSAHAAALAAIETASGLLDAKLPSFSDSDDDGEAERRGSPRQASMSSLKSLASSLPRSLRNVLDADEGGAHASGDSAGRPAEEATVVGASSAAPAVDTGEPGKRDSSGSIPRSDEYVSSGPDYQGPGGGAADGGAATAEAGAPGASTGQAAALAGGAQTDGTPTSTPGAGGGGEKFQSEAANSVLSRGGTAAAANDAERVTQAATPPTPPGADPTREQRLSLASDSSSTAPVPPLPVVALHDARRRLILSHPADVLFAVTADSLEGVKFTAADGGVAAITAKGGVPWPKSGVTREGDVLVAVNGRDVSTQRHEAAVQAVRAAASRGHVLLTYRSAAAFGVRDFFYGSTDGDGGASVAAVPPAGIEALPDGSLRGYLEVRTHGAFNRWIQRYFVLDRDHMLLRRYHDKAEYERWVAAEAAGNAAKAAKSMPRDLPLARIRHVTERAAKGSQLAGTKFDVVCDTSGEASKAFEPEVRFKCQTPEEGRTWASRIAELCGETGIPSQMLNAGRTRRGSTAEEAALRQWALRPHDDELRGDDGVVGTGSTGGAGGFSLAGNSGGSGAAGRSAEAALLRTASGEPGGWTTGGSDADEVPLRHGVDLTQGRAPPASSPRRKGRRSPTPRGRRTPTPRGRRTPARGRARTPSPRRTSRQRSKHRRGGSVKARARPGATPGSGAAGSAASRESDERAQRLSAKARAQMEETLRLRRAVVSEGFVALYREQMLVLRVPAHEVNIMDLDKSSRHVQPTLGVALAIKAGKLLVTGVAPDPPARKAHAQSSTAAAVQLTAVQVKRASPAATKGNLSGMTLRQITRKIRKGDAETEAAVLAVAKAAAEKERHARARPSTPTGKSMPRRRRRRHSPSAAPTDSESVSSARSVGSGSATAASADGATTPRRSALEASPSRTPEFKSSFRLPGTEIVLDEATPSPGRRSRRSTRGRGRGRMTRKRSTSPRPHPGSARKASRRPTAPALPQRSPVKSSPGAVGTPALRSPGSDKSPGGGRVVTVGDALQACPLPFVNPKLEAHMIPLDRVVLPSSTQQSHTSGSGSLRRSPGRPVSPASGARRSATRAVRNRSPKRGGPRSRAKAARGIAGVGGAVGADGFGGAAEHPSGLRRGDVILWINNVSVEGMPADEIRARLHPERMRKGVFLVVARPVGVIAPMHLSASQQAFGTSLLAAAGVLPDDGRAAQRLVGSLNGGAGGAGSGPSGVKPAVSRSPLRTAVTPSSSVAPDDDSEVLAPEKDAENDD